MEDNQVSRTALINAYIRGYHATNDTPKIFDDFLAHQLLTEEEHKSFDHSLYYLRSFNAESYFIIS